MRIFKFLIISALFFNFFSACQTKTGGEEEGQQELYDEVMAVHDEVMPKMQDIMNLKEQIRGKIERLSQQTGTEAEVEQLDQMINRLDEADEAMMNWMRNFKRDYEGMSEEEVINYLEEEKEKITEVRQEMLNTIEEAQGVLEE